MAATVAFQKKASVGPFLLEVVHLTGVTDLDTFTTIIQRPLFVFACEQGADAASTVQAAVSGRTVTLHDQTAAGATGDISVIVVGF